jgi:hypothetical protein
MKRLGYKHFVAQGGDWGDAVTEQMAVQAPPELLAIHTNMPATVPDDIAKDLAAGGSATSQVFQPTRSMRTSSLISSISTDWVMRKR